MNRTTPILALTVLALAACGGGGGEGNESGPPQRRGDESTRLQATESTWVRVATEWQAFVLTAPTRVRYGAGSTWIERDLPAGQAFCTNTFFGIDPLPGIVKLCEAQQTTTTGPWVFLAAESQAFRLATAQRVRYGMGTTWIERDLPAGDGQCSNAFFGIDPLPGIVKQCETVQTTSSGSWTFLADEWQAFQLGAARRVRYGMGTTWIERDLPAGDGQCSNTFFGIDPLPGVVKRCDVQDAGTPPPPPPPPPSLEQVIYVSPSGSDSNDGATRATPLQTLRAAWQKVPAAPTRAVRIALLPGTYPFPAGSNSFFDKTGSPTTPITLAAADGAGTAVVAGGASFGRVKHFAIEDVEFRVRINEPYQSNNVLQVQASDQVALKRVRLFGPDYENPNAYVIQEVLKVNQTTNFSVADSELAGSYQTALDFMAVHGAQVLRNRIHSANGWCAYVKGGSANIRVEGNEMWACTVGGFSAGEGSDHQFQLPPYLTYETYGVQIVNNVFRDMPGHGVGVQGSYNTLVAHNTFYNVAQSPRGYGLALVAHGARSCGNQTICDRYIALGGWSSTSSAWPPALVPNRHVWIHNNVFLQDGVSTQYGTFAVYPSAPQPPTAVQLPNPALTDDDLRISGNIIWNVDRDLGVGAPSQGCQVGNPTCNAATLLAGNLFNTARPQLVNPSAGNWRPVAGGTVFTTPTIQIPPFSWADAPPGVPQGASNNTVATDRNGVPRTGAPVAGAYAAPG